MTTIHSAEEEVLLKLKSLSQVSSDLSKGGPPFRSPSDDSKVERLTQELHFFHREESRRFAGVGGRRSMNGKWQHRWGEGGQDNLGEGRGGSGVERCTGGPSQTVKGCSSLGRPRRNGRGKGRCNLVQHSGRGSGAAVARSRACTGAIHGGSRSSLDRRGDWTEQGLHRGGLTARDAARRSRGAQLTGGARR